MRILICNDGSAQADKAMRLGVLIAAGCKAEATLFGIQESPGSSDAILDSLKRGQSMLEDRGVHAELIVKSGDPILEIRKRSEEAQYDLIVIGAVRKEMRGPFWMSSKAYKIIKELQPPVLAVMGARASLKQSLVCTGGKRFGETALRLVGDIARGAGAVVTLFHVVPEPPAIYSSLRAMEESAARLLNSRSELGRNLRHDKEALEAMGVATGVKLGHGFVLEEILREVRRGDYDMVVAGSTASRGLRTYILGGITREIVNRVSGAVLIVRNPPAQAEARRGLHGLFGGLKPQV